MKYHYLRSCLAKLALLETRREKVLSFGFSVVE
jgi:hypothetical protein